MTYPFSEYRIQRGRNYRINVFEYVIAGEGEVWDGVEWQRVKEGDIYILREGEVHNYRSCKNNPMYKIWINYTAAYMKSFLDSYSISSGVYRSKVAIKYFDRIHKDLLGGKYVRMNHFEIALAVNNIVYSLSSEKNGRIGGDAYTIRRILDGCVYGQISLDGLSDELHMSKSNIIRVFKKEYGITPYNYLINLKIEASKSLLESTQMTVKEISERVGICDSHYFSNLFLNRIGKRPRDYRKQDI